MSTRDEVLKIGKKLDKLISSDSTDQSGAVDLLNALKDLPINLEVLQKTKIGVTVNNVRKACTDEETISLSKSLIKAWKKLIPETGGSHGESSRSGRTHSGGSHKESDRKEGGHKEKESDRKEGGHKEKESDRKDGGHKESGHKISSHHSGGSSSKSSSHGDQLGQPARRCGGLSSTSARSASAASASDESQMSTLARSDSIQSCDSTTPQQSNDASLMLATTSQEKQTDSCTEDSGLPLSPTPMLPSVEIDETRDPMRIKCRDMLAAALRGPPVIDGGGDSEILAAEIEHFVYQQFENTDNKYKNRIRSRITNIKDVKNPRLRENIIHGYISPKQFSMMSPEDMASDEMKKLRDKLAKEAFNDHQMSTNSGTTSDLFKCGRCGKRKTTYNQLQTRSSDEPMTTFVFCNECGYRWKFC